MGFLDRLLGRGKEVAGDVGEKVDDLMDRDDKGSLGPEDTGGPPPSSVPPPPSEEEAEFPDREAGGRDAT
jgi:hypothetical protein